MVKWFKKAIYLKPPFSLGGWKKNKPPTARRRCALASRPKNLSLVKRRLSAGRALLALSNVTKDAKTKKVALRDAKYFFRKNKNQQS